MTVTNTIRPLGFDKLNLPEFLACHISVRDFALEATPTKISCTTEMIDAYSAAIDELQKLVHRDTKSVYTAEIEKADDERDKTLHSIFALIDASAISVLENVSEHGKTLQNAIRLYRDATKSPIAEETVEVQGLLDTLQQSQYTADIAAIQHLNELIAALVIRNNQVKSLMAQRSAVEVPKANTDMKRAAAEAIYDSIVQRANASVILLPSEAVNTFIVEVNNVIDRTNTVYKMRIGALHARKKKEEEGVPVDPEPPVDPPVVPDPPVDPPVDPDLPAD